jgi:Ca2+-binding RTX toxin-like protein
MTYTHRVHNADIAMFDKAAIHYLYGVNPNAKAGSNTYHISDRYIWDGNGIDTITAAEQRQAVYLNLHPGSWIYAGIISDSILAPKQAFIGLGTTIENAIGGNGSDTIFGNDFDNNIQGGNGNDILNAGDGNDTLNDGSGNDTLTGSDGADQFVFDAKTGNTNIDTIADFTTGTDKIVLEHAIFKKLPLTVMSDQLIIGIAAIDSNDYLIYNSTSGILFYDADGSGKDKAVGIALIGTTLNLTPDDFVIN